MSDTLLQALQSAKNQTERAAIVAETTFVLLPDATALVARRCVVLHWFDQLIVETLLEDSELTLDEMGQVYEQLGTLPFIDTVPWGLAFQNITREGLIKRYSSTQPELLQTAARIVAPAYEMREEEKRCVTEAFFCYIVAGDQASSVALQKVLFEEANSSQDWWYLDSLLQLQAEAEFLPFVRPLPRTEQFFLLQGLVHRVQNKRDAALLDYQQVLNINPISVLAYVSRGTTHAEQDHYNEALADYNSAIRIERNFAPAYLSRGVIYSKQGKYKDALRDNSRAMQLGLNTDTVFISRGSILYELGQYEDALAACDAALRLNPDAVDGYIGRGESLNALERYNEALQAYEAALFLNPSTIGAHMGKGQALNELQRYEDALVAFNTAIRLAPTIADAYRGKGKALSGLKRYAEATVAYEQADQLAPPLPQENTVEYEDIDEDEKPRKPNPTERTKDTGPVTFFGRLTRAFRTRQPARRKPSAFWRGVNNTFAVVAVSILVIAIALISSIHNSSLGGVGPYATATAIAKNHKAPKAPITSADVATATATAYQNIYTQATSGTPTITDPLSGGDNFGWSHFTSSTGSCTFTGKAYHARVPVGYFIQCIAIATNFSDLAFQVEETIISGTTAGLLFRCPTDGKFYACYQFYVNTDGTYIFNKVSNDKNNTFTPLRSGSSSAIHTGLNQTNLLSIVARGSTFYLYINQQFVTSASDDTYKAGSIGVAADSSDTSGTEAVFSNLKAWQL